MPARERLQVCDLGERRAPQFASRGFAAGSAGGRRRDSVAHCSYRLSWSPALAEIVGEGRPWTVLMISELSMPCR
jgi:hypothetical protein